MGKLCWDFPPKGSGNEQGYTDSGIELFKGKELLENLAREICQNSLDAKDPDADGPVEVTFSLRMVQKEKHVLFSEYSQCLESCKENWKGRMDNRLKDFLSAAERMLAGSEIPVLVASDFNTKGLTGAYASEDEKSPWRALAHTDGASVAKDSDSAGSYGIGKNAPFACTALSTVFYNTFAIDGSRAFQGTARMATLKIDGKKTVGTGHYLYLVNDENWRPIKEEDGCSFLNEFSRERHGTDIIVVGFNEVDNWIDRMVHAIVSNFFLAIHERKLIVTIQDQVINAEKLPGIIEQYKDARRIEDKTVYECYQALISPDGDAPIKLSILKENDVELYLKSNNEYHNRVSYFRTSGMRIRLLRAKSYQPCSAVIVIRDKKLNEVLREAEPPRHNKWDPTLIKHDDKLKNLAQEALDKLDDMLREELRKKYERTGIGSQDSGEGDYLPDDVDSAQNEQQGDDILRVRQKLAAVHISKVSPGSTSTSGTRGIGAAMPGDSYGARQRKEKKNGHKVVNGNGDKKGVTPGKGTAPMSIINFSSHKSYMIDQNQGLYRVLLKVDKDYPKVQLTFSAIGEDDDREALTVQKYAFRKVTQKVGKNAVGPVSLSADEVNELFVTFEIKEKMRLNISAVEVK